jgi:hypothetical protein
MRVELRMRPLLTLSDCGLPPWIYLKHGSKTTTNLGCPILRTALFVRRVGNHNVSRPLDGDMLLILTSIDEIHLQNVLTLL